MLGSLQFGLHQATSAATGFYSDGNLSYGDGSGGLALTGLMLLLSSAILPFAFYVGGLGPDFERFVVKFSSRCQLFFGVGLQLAAAVLSFCYSKVGSSSASRPSLCEMSELKFARLRLDLPGGCGNNS